MPPRQRLANRRQFLVGCSTLALAVSASPVLAGTRLTPGRTKLEQISFEDFAAQVDTPFDARDGSGARAMLQLIEARAIAAHPANSPAAADAHNEKFSLFFIGSSLNPLSQDTCAFEHRAIGRFEMFISRVGPVGQGRCFYEAAFNRPSHPALSGSQTQNNRAARNRLAR